MIEPTLSLACRTLGALVFATAVAGKLRHRAELPGIVADYRIIPGAMAAPVAYGIVALEAFVALSLATGLALRPGAMLAASLLWAFAAVVGVNLVRGRSHIECGCFGSGVRRRLGADLVVRNLVLGAAMGIPVASVGAPVGPLGAFEGMACGATAFLLGATLERLRLSSGVAASRERFA